ncbi:AraC family transcriptional regulator [Andreprevotia chitinilytica]|uniref:AraC family transcriptional regulator n=1 Tax=Andreprevotia chitinilytica TaxID=396808 RepID=UPI00054F63C0|nr:AraC family transcriptional regulator [Andreprevotia chitinilytica]
MAAIYLEKFEISPENQQRKVGARVFYHPSLAALNTYDVMMAGVSNLTAGYRVERCDAPFHVVVFCVDGEGAVLERGKALPMQPGDVAVLPAGSETGLLKTGPAWRTVWFLLYDMPRWSGLNRPDVVIWPSIGNEQLYLATDVLCREALVTTEDDPCCDAALVLVMRLLQRVLGQQPKEDEALDALSQLFANVRHAPGEAWRVEQLAEDFGVSPAHFQRLCQRYFHCSPRQMLLNIRMACARELFQSGIRSVGDVAQRVGYAEIASFSRRFSQHFGQNPGELIRQLAAMNTPHL